MFLPSGSWRPAFSAVASSLMPAGWPLFGVAIGSLKGFFASAGGGWPPPWIPRGLSYLAPPRSWSVCSGRLARCRWPAVLPAALHIETV